MQQGAGAPSSNSSGSNNNELAYLKKLASDLQAKIHSLENAGLEKLDAAKHKVESVIDGVTSTATGGAQKDHMGLLLMGPPGSGV